MVRYTALGMSNPRPIPGLNPPSPRPRVFTFLDPDCVPDSMAATGLGSHPRVLFPLRASLRGRTGTTSALDFGRLHAQAVVFRV